MRDLKKTGEFGLIEIFKKIAGGGIGNEMRGLIAGIGDDAAVVSSFSGKGLLTCDMLIEDVHFSKKYSDFYRIGFKAMAVNLSDIAAMAGTAKYALVSLGVPSGEKTRDITELFRGIYSCAKKYGVKIAGGDTVRSVSKIVVDIFILGECLNPVLRSKAEINDKILVTGTLGDASAGLKVLKNKMKGNGFLVKKFRSPHPRLREAKVISRFSGVHSMIDISDGLSSEINHICRLSGKGAVIHTDKIPVSGYLLDFCEGSRKKALSYALCGGEDYELLFTAKAKQAENIAEEISGKTGTKTTVIGEISDKSHGVFLADEKGRKKKNESKGFDHFG